jgi:hypothetical protein
MPDDPINEDDEDQFTEDPRINELIREAPTMTEVLLNAEFLLDGYVTEYLKTGYPETYRMVRTLRMTPEQKFLLAVGSMGKLEDTQCWGQEIFGFLSEIYKIRARAGKGSEDELSAGLKAAYLCTGGENARQECSESDDIDEHMRALLAEYLTYAQFCMERVVMVPDDDDEEDDDDDDDGEAWKK